MSPLLDRELGRRLCALLPSLRLARDSGGQTQLRRLVSGLERVGRELATLKTAPEQVADVDDFLDIAFLVEDALNCGKL